MSSIHELALFNVLVAANNLGYLEEIDGEVLSVITGASPGRVGTHPEITKAHNAIKKAIEELRDSD